MSFGNQNAFAIVSRSSFQDDIRTWQAPNTQVVVVEESGNVSNPRGGAFPRV